MSWEPVGGGGVIVEDEGPAGDPKGGDPDEWAEVASLGTGRRDLAGASDADGLIYAIGGRSDANSYESVVEQYDPATDTWTTVASLGTARRGLAGASDANGLVYAIGGEVDGFEVTSVVEQYDSATDTWTTVASLGTARLELAGASDADGLVYAIGGDSEANTFESVVEQLRFDPLFADAYSATGDTLFAADDDDAELLNRTTGRIANPNVARDGETIAWFVESQARLVRTEEQ